MGIRLAWPTARSHWHIPVVKGCCANQIQQLCSFYLLFLFVFWLLPLWCSYFGLSMIVVIDTNHSIYNIPYTLCWTVYIHIYCCSIKNDKINLKLAINWRIEFTFPFLPAFLKFRFPKFRPSASPFILMQRVTHCCCWRWSEI
jgi:hypothetical protein